MRLATVFVALLLATAIAFVAPAAAEPTGQLNVAENQFPTSLDADVGFAGYSLMSYGIAEALTRVTPDMHIVPWLASSLDPVDELTWRVTIRDGATFWDGIPVDAEAVKASLLRSLEMQPAAASLIAAGANLSADGQVLTIRLPAPVGGLPSNLASYSLTIKKLDPDGNPVYTGPFSYSDWMAQQSMTLHAYSSYWDGPPAVQTIGVRYIPDVSARVLALQAGDVDIAHALLPSDAAPLQAAGFQVFNFPFGRQDDMILNVTRAPLDDANVRRAISYAIDRNVLVSGILDGIGTPATGLAPDNLGLTGIVPTQQYDTEQARSLLDTDGWVVGNDGIRAKAGQRLTFKLGTYASRPELAPLAVAIKDQLRAVGIDATLETFSEDTYRLALAFAQILPGPLAAQCAIALGYFEEGFPGAALVGLAFVLPSFVMVIALSIAYVAFGGLWWMQALFYGIGAAVIAIITIAAYKLARTTNKQDPLLWGIFALLLAVTVLTRTELAVIFVVAGILTLLVKAPPAWLKARLPSWAAAPALVPMHF